MSAKFTIKIWKIRFTIEIAIWWPTEAGGSHLFGRICKYIHNMDEIKNQRGGRRQGAGRKAISEEELWIAFRFTTFGIEPQQTLRNTKEINEIRLVSQHRKNRPLTGFFLILYQFWVPPSHDNLRQLFRSKPPMGTYCGSGRRWYHRGGSNEFLKRMEVME